MILNFLFNSWLHISSTLLLLLVTHPLLWGVRIRGNMSKLQRCFSPLIEKGKKQAIVVRIVNDNTTEQVCRNWPPQQLYVLANQMKFSHLEDTSEKFWPTLEHVGILYWLLMEWVRWTCGLALFTSPIELTIRAGCGQDVLSTVFVKIDRKMRAHLEHHRPLIILDTQTECSRKLHGRECLIVCGMR